MNFKPTLWKSITSIISGILVNYFLAGTAKVLCNCFQSVPCNCPQPKWIEFAFDPVPLVISILAIGSMYIVWSIIQKK